MKRSRKNGQVKALHKTWWNSVPYNTDKKVEWKHSDYQYPQFWNFLLHQKMKVEKSQNIYYTDEKKEFLERINYKLSYLKELTRVCDLRISYNNAPLSLNGFVVPNAVLVSLADSKTDNSNIITIHTNGWSQVWIDGAEIDFSLVTKITRPFQVWSLLQNFEYNGKWFTAYCGKADYAAYSTLITNRDWSLYLEFKDKI